MEKTLKPAGDERTMFEGKIFEIVRKPLRAGNKIIEAEFARRSPGVRLLILKDKRMLLIKEFRFELDAVDYRLPGGKVFDTLKEYRKSLDKANILESAAKAAKKECLEETGLIAKNAKHLQTAIAGATVKWDLFYFVIDNFQKSKRGQNLEYGEESIVPVWKSFSEVKKLCLDNSINEDRTVGVLLKFLLQKET
ncbi:NUDIX domain-containing protein [Candidatus Woesearchaeota archaeon]|nr:NUDIX domain-containing protein [Candidatus Woesearchaeota archaeon]